ncbi:hypothetical protein [Streptomyces sp. NPDC001948]
MDRDDEQLLRRRVYGADHDHPGPRPDRAYAELVGGPLDSLPLSHRPTWLGQTPKLPGENTPSTSGGVRCTPPPSCSPAPCTRHVWLE